MRSELLQGLSMKTQAYSRAYVRNLVAAEKAVLMGQFNAAKILRAAAHAQRVLAMKAERLTSGTNASEVFEAILSEVDTDRSEPDVPDAISGLPEEIEKELNQIKVVENRVNEIVGRSLASLQENNDVLESDVNQVIWGCYGCGYLIEGELPDACPICGALSIEFEWFGPFYSSTSEHLGQRNPQEIMRILEKIPAEVEALIGSNADDSLGVRPSDEEWSVKEIIGHIIQVERLFLKRVQTMIENTGLPELPRSAPPWMLHEGKGYENRNISELLNQLTETRATTLAFLSNLKNEDWVRKGSNQGSPVSLLDLGTWLANHDLGHTAQIKRYITTSG